MNTFIFLFHTFFSQVLLDNFSDECKTDYDTNDRNLILIDVYEKLEKVFGLYFLMFFFTHQLFLILQSYIMFSFFIGQSHELFYAEYIQIVGNFILSFGIVIMMNVIVNSADNAFASIKNKERELEEKLHATEEKMSRRDLKYLIKKMEKLKPLSAAGYFDIQKSCLTSMFSIR